VGTCVSWENEIKLGLNGTVDWIHVAHEGFIVVEGCFAGVKLLSACLCTCRYIAVTQPIKYYQLVCVLAGTSQ